MDSRILHYEFVTGESVNITVSAEIAEVIYNSRRMEHASNERSRYQLNITFNFNLTPYIEGDDAAAC